MQPKVYPVVTTKIRINGITHDAVDLGPLCVNFGTRQQGWVVTHRATGSFIGQSWSIIEKAVTAAGALLALPIDWTKPHPVNANTESLVLNSLERVEQAVGR